MLKRTRLALIEEWKLLCLWNRNGSLVSLALSGQGEGEVRGQVRVTTTLDEQIMVYVILHLLPDKQAP
jgi:hypothetical protein